MDPNDFTAIQPIVKHAVDDLEQLLAGMDAAEQLLVEMGGLHARLEAGERLSDGPAAPRLTREQYAALDWRTVDGQPIGDEEREAILSVTIPAAGGDERAAPRDAWVKSSREAAAQLRELGRSVAANNIDGLLDKIPSPSTQPTEVPADRAAILKAATHIRTIFRRIMKRHLDAGPSAAAPVGAAAEQPAENSSDAVRSLLRAYAPGLADDRIEQACRVLAGGRTVWWKRTRKGRRDEAAGEREDRLRQRGQNYEWDGRALDDE